jgi:tRNA (guanine-N7-)-methyltransferase
VPKNKLKRFSENLTFPNFFQPTIEEAVNGFHLKGKWSSGFFKNNNPVVLELGCGKGEYTVALARKYPDRNYIGIDIKGARMWRGCKTSVEEGMTNVAFIRTRVDFISGFFEKDEVSEIWITFPDPQPRKKQVKKRLTSPRFIDRYKQLLAPNGIIHLKTDNTEMYLFTLSIIEQEGYKLIYQTADLYDSGFEGDAVEVRTFYEEKFLKEGKAIKYIQFGID